MITDASTDIEHVPGGGPECSDAKLYSKVNSLSRQVKQNLQQHPHQGSGVNVEEIAELQMKTKWV